MLTKYKTNRQWL